MTIILILGVFAGLYMLWLVFSLAIYALPFWAGVTTAFFMHNHGQGLIASILGGFGVAILVLAGGQVLFSTVRSPLARLGLALLYAVPAGIAGYHAVYGIGSMAIGAGAIVTILSWIGAFVIAAAAWRRLTTLDVATSPTQPTATPSVTTSI
ncbi:hypothetical protein DFR49_1300 [Hephaestia caeni]|uniref:Uncharacterized protein n=1 Tax=Hephaestia caeni TaxID=645617 RepID=A0A397PHK5_9SPHN|nr:hypothetical protein [Hephaestia caeni]RIA46745.1 hypothetical protein DFR49_1300 [Hephaestia caeni]